MSFSFDYTPYGKTLEAFMQSDAIVRGLMGPVGGGKTHCCIAEIIRRAQAQDPDEFGVRRFKCIAVRHTYRQLEDTTIPDWKRAFTDPKTDVLLGHWKGGSGGEPATHTIKLALNDGTKLIFQMQFRAIGDNAVETFCRGLAITMLWLNEADTLPYELFIGLLDRVGRFPMTATYKATWKGVICDFNAPNKRNWCFEVFIRNLPDIWKFFRQPSGLSPNFENREIIGGDFYKNKVVGMPDWWVRRMVENKFGFSRDGKPVYPDFDDVLHVSKELEVNPYVPLYCGIDGGRTPAAVFGQSLPSGHKTILREFCLADAGAGKFGKLLQSFIAREFPDHVDFRFVGDPAASKPTESSEEDFLTIISNILGEKVLPGRTNNLTARLTAVEKPLTNLIDGKPELMVSDKCPILIDGFMSDYRYRKVNRSGDSDYFDEEPDKHAVSSHPHDAAQQMMLEMTGYRKVLGKDRRRRSKKTGGYNRFAKV